jgi:hypothetical protein
LASLSGVLIGLLAGDSATGQIAWQGGALCLGPLVGSLGAIAMVLLRNRAQPVKLPLPTAILLWLMGTTLGGFGVLAALTPGDTPVTTNLGYSVALCFTPAAVLTLLGLGLYAYSQRRGAEPEPAAVVPAEAADYAGLRNRAAEYRRRILAAIQAKKGAAFGDQLGGIADEVGRWEEQVDRLVERLAQLDADPILRRDRRETPAQIAQLEGQLVAEGDPQVRQQMAETLAGYRQQQAQLEDLSSLLRRTRLQLDQTLSAMGTIYSQVQTLGALEVDSSRARRISADIDEQAASLADLLAAMSETYGGADAPAATRRAGLSRTAGTVMG